MTERITPSMVSANVLHNLSESFAALNRSSEELSSGKSILQPSDNPFGAGKAIDLQSTLDGLASYLGNVKEAISWQNTATTALSSIGDIVQRVREIVLQGVSGVDNKSDLESLADQVEQLTESVKQDANVRYGESYVLSGTLTQTAPYSPGAEDSYHGNEGSIARAIAPGASLQIGGSAATLLGEGPSAGDGKLLDTLRTITAHLREGTPEAVETLRNTDLPAIDANASALLRLQTHVGTVVQQLRAAEGSIEEMRITTMETLSNVQDTNIAQTSIEYSSQQAGYEAALRAGASIVQMSLLQFLK
jgi:flagellar hook-associated protein 3 FlgL